MTVTPLRSSVPAMAGLALAALAGLAGTALADEIGPQVGHWRAGVVCASTFPNGRLTGNLPFIAETKIVPAVQGIGFGVEAMGAGGQDIRNVTITVTHPPIRGTTVETFSSAISGQALSAFYYRLERPEEVVTGTWRITARAEGVVIYTIDFDLILPSPDDGLLRACRS